RTAPRRWRASRSRAEGSAGVELEHHAADLHVPARLEPRGLEGADHAHRAQAVLHVALRVLVLHVVPGDQALDPAPRHAEGAVTEALDTEAVVAPRAVHAVLRGRRT